MIDVIAAANAAVKFGSAVMAAVAALTLSRRAWEPGLAELATDCIISLLVPGIAAAARGRALWLFIAKGNLLLEKIGLYIPAGDCMEDDKTGIETD